MNERLNQTGDESSWPGLEDDDGEGNENPDIVIVPTIHTQSTSTSKEESSTVQASVEQKDTEDVGDVQ